MESGELALYASEVVEERKCVSSPAAIMILARHADWCHVIDGIGLSSLLHHHVFRATFLPLSAVQASPIKLQIHIGLIRMTDVPSRYCHIVATVSRVRCDRKLSTVLSSAAVSATPLICIGIYMIQMNMHFSAQAAQEHAPYTSTHFIPSPKTPTSSFLDLMIPAVYSDHHLYR